MREILGSRRFWAAVVTAVALVGLMGLTRRQIGRLGVVQSLLNEALAPVEYLAETAGRATASANASVHELFRLHQENAALRAQVARMQEQVTQDAELRQQNAQLQLLLGLRDVLDREFPYADGKAAQVIARSPNTWFQSLVVDKGRDDGVHVGMVAVAPGGLVGRVSAVSPHTASVMLLTNPDSGVGAMVESSRDLGVALGQLGRPELSMEFFSTDPNVRKDDVVVTSGLGLLFPKGIPVGRVTAVGEGDFGLVRQATVHPSVDLSRLESLLLIEPPPQLAVPATGGSG